MHKIIIKLLMLSALLFIIGSMKEESFAADSHVHEYVNEINCNITHHWRDCKWFPADCPGPNQSVLETFESHIPGPFTNCTTGVQCAVCGTYMGQRYPSHDIPISGGKCKRAGCNYSCDHQGQQGVCDNCGVNLKDPSANVYVHTHQWGSEYATAEFLYDSNADYHWMNCYNPECPISDISGKNGFGTHVYELDDTCATEVVCSVCNYAVRIGYSKHDYSSVDGKCQREDCSQECEHNAVSKGKCLYCGYVVPVKEETVSEGNSSTSNPDGTDNSSEKEEVNAPGSEAVNETSEASKDSKETSVSDKKETVTGNKNTETSKESEGGFFKTLFGKIGSFFSNLFKKK